VQRIEESILKAKIAKIFFKMFEIIFRSQRRLTQQRNTNFESISNFQIDNCFPSPDCNENPFLQKKIVMESGIKLQIKKWSIMKI
jgi:hypothetical protein